MSYNVVCLEDDWDLSRLIALTVRQWTPSVYVAHDGIQGLSLIRQHCPDLILLDLGLPGLNGWEVYSEIKKDAALYQIPIIVFTAIPYDEQAMYLNSIGQVSAYILKPVTLPALRQILEPFFVHNDAISSTKGL
jgi:CheY-like chemotaxis protein